MRLGQRVVVEPPLRICLDANVWVSYLDALTNGRPTTVLRIVQAVQDMRFGGVPLQLVLAHELIDTVDRVLRRQGFSDDAVRALVAGLGDLMRAGPEHLEPPLLLAGRDQLAMHDREDAGVLAACLAAEVGLLVTGNLRDFAANDAQRFDTRKVSYRDGSTRQLFALIFERADGRHVVVMHPIDAADWLASGERPAVEKLRKRYRFSASR